MKHVRILRALAGFGLLVGLTLFVVLPALASTPGALVPPPSADGITPVDVNTGGQSNDCALFGSSGANQFRIANPKTQTYTTTVNGSSVTFRVTLNPDDAKSSPAYGNDKYLDFTSTGASIVDVGVKGGTDETRYHYPTAVAADGILHGPAQSVAANGDPTQLYSVSNLTFCFNVLAGTVSGSVYRDANQNGANDAGDSALSGWTVHLYKGSTLVGTTGSTASGAYSFTTPLDTSSVYRVCEAPPSGTWAQTEPVPSSSNICTGAGELGKGYSLSPSSVTQNLTGNDFGNVPAIPCAQPMEYTLADGTDYQVRLANCKTGQTFVFSSGVTGAGNPFVSIWAGDQSSAQSQNRQPMVEKITIPNVLNGDGSFKYTKLNYTDALPFDPNNTQLMPACELDPRLGPASLTLSSSPTDYTVDSAKTAILPGTATSCLISSSAFVDSAGKSWFVAYVYSDIDGLRTST